MGPLIFNVFLCDLFKFIRNTELVSYADDNTPFAMDSSELEVINEIKNAEEELCKKANQKVSALARISSLIRFE